MSGIWDVLKTFPPSEETRSLIRDWLDREDHAEESEHNHDDYNDSSNHSNDEGDNEFSSSEASVINGPTAIRGGLRVNDQEEESTASRGGLTKRARLSAQSGIPLPKRSAVGTESPNLEVPKRAANKKGMTTRMILINCVAKSSGRGRTALVVALVPISAD